MPTDPSTHTPQGQPRARGTPPSPARVAPHSLLLGRTSTVVAWLVLVTATLHPPHGLGLPLCWFQATTGVPCCGCGLSRSLSCTVRGMFQEAWGYHPFGAVFLVVFLVIAGASLLPPPARRRLTAWLDHAPRATLTAYVALVGLFIAFGTLRALGYLFW